VVLVNRIKAHTDFRSEIESGLMKMASIGLGKHEQALALHGYGVEGISDFMVEVGDKVLESGHILFGVATVENAYDEPAIIEAIPAAEIHEREAELLAEYMQMMPDLPVSEIDVLYVDALGKNYSGAGMDPNVIGRLMVETQNDFARPVVTRLVVLDVSDESHGNIVGVGFADLTTELLVSKVDPEPFRINVLTSCCLERARIPITLPTDRDVMAAALDVVIVRPLRRRNGGEDALAIITIALNIVLATELTRRVGTDILPSGAPWGNHTTDLSGAGSGKTYLLPSYGFLD